ncbi:MAG: 50S ribosome-binding GTPase [Phycisphaerales bacterium]|nr:50S ribosome-binding GTPase [Phycisphaerales bacterium]
MTSPQIDGVVWRLASPPGGQAAIAVIELIGRDGAAIDSAGHACGMGELRVGEVKLADLFGVDRGIAARWSQTLVHLMPHAGPVVVMKIAEKLLALGMEERREIDARAAYPEARDEVEAQMLAALAKAHSPRAVDLLLDQPRRWRARAQASTPTGEADAKTLNRLIEPALVVAVGPSNVGKSTLLNALAGRAVSVVADEPGTTRDHVGVLLDLGGVVVRYVDTPGMRIGAPVVERQALATAMELVNRADLVLACGDGDEPAPMMSVRNSIRVGLRADLRPIMWQADVKVCAPLGQGIESLVKLAREALVPEGAIRDARAWKFWG